MKKYFLLTMFIAINLYAYKPVTNAISTKWGAEINPEKVWTEYPRPQMEREDWLNLNGLWDYAIRAKTSPAPQSYDGKILVPFCIESSLSGVAKKLTQDQNLWYHTQFETPTNWKSKDIILNFEAVDYQATVWLNGALVQNHKGGYDRFSCNIKPYLKPSGPQDLVVCVSDPTSSGEQPRGKQVLNAGGIFYTAVSGIWQPVWLEPVSSDEYISEFKIIPDIDNSKVSIKTMINRQEANNYTVKVLINGQSLSNETKNIHANNMQRFELKKAKLWSPDSPYLYDLELVLQNSKGQEIDRIKSYFGMRKISLGETNGHKILLLNNQKLFQYGTLDQGWWPDGLYTPPSDAAMKYDIEMTKEMGFNMIRKHVKIEPARWYYHCDKLGMLVWQDMPSATGRIDQKRNINKAQNEYELSRMIDLHFNSPSIVVWVPFNEGWGQYDTERISEMIKSKDSTRLVNAASGWVHKPCGDIYDLHDYSVNHRKLQHKTGQATVVGEFGGIGYPIKNHLWDPKKNNWGYQSYKSDAEYLKQYIHKFEQIDALRRTNYLSAAVYTQTTDVESEVNGLMTYDRKVIKIPLKKLKAIHQKLNLK